MNMLHGLPVVGGMLLCVFGRRMMIKITFFAYAPYESNPGEGTDQKIILSAQSDKRGS